MQSAVRRAETTESFRGRVTLVNFWVSWYTICHVEMPALDSLRRAFSDSGVAFVSINADHSRASADRFLRNLGLTFDYALGDAHTSATYHVPGLPFTVLLDREGRVVQREERTRADCPWPGRQIRFWPLAFDDDAGLLYLVGYLTIGRTEPSASDALIHNTIRT